MSGIASARALQAAGLPVRLIDKGLVFLGKKALRRAAVAGEGLTFDHDVQSLDRRQLAESVTALGRSFGYVVLIRWNQPYCWLA